MSSVLYITGDGDWGGGRVDCLTTPGTSTGVHELLEQTESEGRHQVESENTGTGCDVRSGGTGVTFSQEVL